MGLDCEGGDNMLQISHLLVEGKRIKTLKSWVSWRFLLVCFLFLFFKNEAAMEQLAEKTTDILFLCKLET